MPFNLASMLRQSEGRQTLTIPVHDQLDNERKWHLVEPILQKCADQIVNSKLVWRWVRYDGRSRVVQWSKPDGVFIGFDIDTWRVWLGQRWKIIDSNGVEWAGPSRAVADRIYAMTLKHPNIPLAPFKLQGEMRKEARK
jgi:hypothetical protein